MEARDEKLWKLAKKRADFKKQLTIYLMIIPILWGIWWFTLGKNEGFSLSTWPIYATFGWGIGIFFSYMEAYGTNREDAIEREYRKLKEKE